MIVVSLAIEPHLLIFLFKLNYPFCYEKQIMDINFFYLQLCLEIGSLNPLSPVAFSNISQSYLEIENKIG